MPLSFVSSPSPDKTRKCFSRYKVRQEVASRRVRGCPVCAHDDGLDLEWRSVKQTGQAPSFHKQRKVAFNDTLLNLEQRAEPLQASPGR